MKLLGSTKNKITKNENGENVPNLGSNYQQNSRVLHTFIPNKPFGQLSDISLKNFIFLKTFDSEYFHIEIWFTDQISKPLDIQDRISITLVINQSVKYKK